jgi:HSP20 family protein
MRYSIGLLNQVSTKTGEDQGSRKTPEKVEGAHFHRQERNFPSFNRAIGLPGEVQADKVSAESKDGVLVITLPKVEEAKPKQIAIKS